MQKYGTFLWNEGWEFRETEPDAAAEELLADRSGFRPVELPHDWLIYHPKELYRNSAGWYRKTVSWQPQEDQRISLLFDGVYMNCTVFVNGQAAGEWKYGYSAFEIELTPYVKPGDNEVMVQVIHESPNSRWYSGAGIYRNVWLAVRHAQARIPEGGCYFSTREAEQDWELLLDTEVEINSREQFRAAKGRLQNQTCRYRLCHELRDSRTGAVVMEAHWADCPAESGTVSLCVPVKDVTRWDVENPQLYEVVTSLYQGEELLQTVSNRIGFRTIAFTPEEGFLLNHRKVKLQGVCEHHDLGCLGAAWSKPAMERKLTILKKMGVNAVRTAHNMPARELMELTDEMGILVMSEAFDMWEKSKNPYDYARFFPEWHSRDLASWIRRDRNHPSVILWSIGNEIYDTHADAHGEELTRMLKEETEALDPRKNAYVTMGSNYMPWEHAQNCADIVKLIGYNYSEGYYEAHHKAHPDWILYGSETSSTVQSRGIYHFPYRQSVLADADRQCSALGNSTTSWGAKNSEACVIAERDHPYSCGQFLWSGFDYIGEPTPYHTRNSYFGQIDTAGFPKDSYYIYKAEWTDYRKEPMVHLFPYWQWNDGQSVDVRICSNAPAVELFLNGESQGVTRLDHAHGTELTAHYVLPFREGVLKAAALDEQGQVIAEDIRYSFGETAALQVTGELYSGLAFLTIQAVDAQGHPVENAANRVHVTVEGSAAYLAGLDNGDSTDLDGYKTNSRRLFQGKLLAVVAVGQQEGVAAVRVTSPGLPEAVVSLQAAAGEFCVCQGWTEDQMRKWNQEETEAPSSAVLRKYACDTLPCAEEFQKHQELPVRQICLTSSRGTTLTAEEPQLEVAVEVLPSAAEDRELSFEITDDSGIPIRLARVKRLSADRALVSAKGDGDFWLRCLSKAGTDEVRLISQLDFHAEGLGKAYLSPYEFVSGGLYRDSRGQVGNGNEHGFATAREGETQVCFRDLDFGEFGADEITVPVFALTDDPYYIQIWEGMPGEEGSSLAADVVYQKPSIWNVYQPETWRLNHRLRGITSLCFVLKGQKVHIKGFSFTRQQKAFARLGAAECSRVYGDAYRMTPDGIEDIGNNVTLEFPHMDFGEMGSAELTICGATPLQKNTIQVRFHSGDMPERKEIVEFAGDGSTKDSVQTFPLPAVTGMQDVSLVFLPGSRFHFRWMRFERKSG